MWINLSEYEIPQQPAADPYRIFAFSDYHAADRHTEHDCHHVQILQARPDLILSGGDHSDLGEDSAAFRDLCRICRTTEGGVGPLGQVLGNHENYGHRYELGLAGALDLNWNMIFLGDTMVFGVDVFSLNAMPPRGHEPQFLRDDTVVRLFSKRVNDHAVFARKKIMISHEVPQEYIPLRFQGYSGLNLSVGSSVVSDIIRATRPGIVCFGHLHTAAREGVPGPPHAYTFHYDFGPVEFINLSCDGGVMLDV